MNILNSSKSPGLHARRVVRIIYPANILVTGLKAGKLALVVVMTGLSMTQIKQEIVMNDLELLKAIPSTEPATFREFCDALESERLGVPEDKLGWGRLFGILDRLE